MARPHVVRGDHDGTILISPIGDFDIASAELLRDALRDAIDPANAHLVVDLAATTFLDSMALGVLIGASRRARGWGGWIRLVAPQPGVRNILSVTGLDDFFGIYDTVDQAVRDVAPSALE